MRVPATRMRAKPKPTSPTGRTLDDVVRSAVSHPAQTRRQHARLLDRRRGRRAALLALPGLRLLHPPAAADLPGRLLEEPGRRSGFRQGDAGVVLDQPPELDAGAGAALRGLD